MKKFGKDYKKTSTKTTPITIGIFVLAAVAIFILVAILNTYRVERVNAQKSFKSFDYKTVSMYIYT